MYPDRILGYVAVNPWFGDIALEEFRRRILEDGMVELKLYVDHMMISYHHPLCDPIFKEAADLDVPVLMHCYDCGASADKVADKHPKVKLILGHMTVGLTGLGWSTRKTS